MPQSYDLIVVGTSFSASFFLHRYLERTPTARVLVLERGIVNTHEQQLVDKRMPLLAAAERAFVNRNPEKQ